MSPEGDFFALVNADRNPGRCAHRGGRPQLRSLVPSFHPSLTFPTIPNSYYLLLAFWYLEKHLFLPLTTSLSNKVLFITLLKACQVRPGKPQSAPSVESRALICWSQPGCVQWRVSAQSPERGSIFCLLNETASTHCLASEWLLRPGRKSMRLTHASAIRFPR